MEFIVYMLCLELLHISCVAWDTKAVVSRWGT